MRRATHLARRFLFSGSLVSGPVPVPVLYMQPTSFHIIARTTRTRDRPTASTPGTVRRSCEAADAPVDGFAARSFAFASSFQADPGKHLSRDALEVDAKIPLLELGHGVGMGDASSAQGELTHQVTSEVTRDAKLPGSVHASHARVGFIQPAVREARGLVRAPGATRESPPFVLAQPRKGVLRGFAPLRAHQSSTPNVERVEVVEYREKHIVPREAQVHRAWTGGRYRAERVVDRATQVYRARTGGRAHDDARGAVETALGDRTFKRIASYFTRA